MVRGHFGTVATEMLLFPTFFCQVKSIIYLARLIHNGNSILSVLTNIVKSDQLKINIYTHIRTYAHMHVPTLIHTHAITHLIACMFKHVHTYIHICTHTHIFKVHTYTYVKSHTYT